MELMIQAPNHPSVEKMEKYYEDKLNRAFGKYPFIVSCLAIVKKETGDFLTNVSLELNPKGGGRIFAEAAKANENEALGEVIKKVRRQLDKFKEKHYASYGRLES